jgi:DNA-binding CsgD family transcriptional regulator
VTRLVAASLVGRESELSALLRVARTPPAIALVVGEAGVGKTRLVQEVLRQPQLQGRTVLVGQCHPLREPFPFGPLVEALAQARRRSPAPRRLTAVTGALRPLLPELDDWLPPPLAPSGDTNLDRHRLFRAVVELLDGFGPTVLVLEDLHWIDPSTLDLLTFLVRHLPPRLALLLTHRDTGASLPAVAALGERVADGVSFTRLSLDQLDDREVRQLVEAILGIASVSDEFASHLRGRTAGLPLAIEEVLGLLQGRRDIAGYDGRAARQALDDLPVPTLLRDSLLERLDRLGAAATRIVHAAAVLEVPAEQGLLTAVAGLPASSGAKALGQAVRHALLRVVDGERGAERYALRHALAVQAVYGSLPPPQRRQLHARAVRALGTVTPPPHAQLAHHCRRLGRTSAWWRHAEAASDAAFRMGDYAAATEFLIQALTAAGQPAGRRLRLAVKLARTAPLGLCHAQAEPLLRRILGEENLPAGRRGELRLALGLMLINQVGRMAAGADEITRGIEELRHRPEVAAGALALLSIPDLTPGHLDDHLAKLDGAMRLLPRVTDAARRSAILRNRVTTLLEIGDPAGWPALEALPGSGETDAERAHAVGTAYNAANSCVFLGHYERAEHWLRETARRVSQASADYVKAISGSIGAHLAWATGRWAEVDGWLRQAVIEGDIAVVAGDTQLLRGLLALARGDLDTAEHELRGGRWANVEPLVWAAEASMNAAGLVRLLLSRGRSTDAAAHARRAVDALRGKGVWVWGAELVPAAVAALSPCEPESARRLVADFADGIAGRDAPLAAAALSMARAQLTEAQGCQLAAAEQYGGAARAHLDLPRPYEAAHAMAAAGRCLFAAGRDGRAQLLEALDGYLVLGAVRDEARCRRILRANGVSMTHRRGRRGYGTRLSPREADVARLAAQGKSNQAIATALYVSERTVEGHVASALRKLGLRSRHELACERLGDGGSDT